MAAIPTSISDRTALSRRRFLGHASAGLGLAALVASPAFAAPARKVRVGIVGGHFGASFFFHEHPDCVVTAVSDLREDRRSVLMKTYGCSNAHQSLASLVKDPQVDAVFIATDGPLHVEHVTLALAHGKHVMSAVPAAWGTIEQAEQLLDAVRKSGLTYMLAETSYYQQTTISARKFFQEGAFGEVISSSSAYQHDGLEQLYVIDGQRTWRYGMAPMHYPTHCTAHLIGVTGERLTDVSCHGWGDDSPCLKDNAYGNPFWNETALFRTNLGHPFECRVWWKGTFSGGERGEWTGSEMSFSGKSRGTSGPTIVRREAGTALDDGGFVKAKNRIENYEQPDWWKTDMLPELLRHMSHHGGSHTFLTHEFVDCLVHERRPAIDVYEALAYTVPGIVAHQSALYGGQSMKIPQYERSAS